MMLLYQTDLVGGDVDAAIASYEGEHGRALAPYAQELVRGVHARMTELDTMLSAHLHDWAIDRLGTVERAVLRIAALELVSEDVPPPVVIDEAVELSKRYATPDAARLVNGVLAGMVRAGGVDTDQEVEG